MSDLDDFLGEVMPRLLQVERSLHNGDVNPRLAMWSKNDPLTLFGALYSNSGWQDVSHAFEKLAAQFSDCTAYEIEILAAGASGDLAYTVGYERIGVSIAGTPRSFALRVTQIYRHEDNEWKLAHRHADELALDSEN